MSRQKLAIITGGALWICLAMAMAVYFSASDQASFITGETNKVDGRNSVGF